MTPVRTVARAFLAAIFVKSGIDAVRNPDRLVDSAKPMVDQLAPALDAVGLPTDPRTLVRLNGAAHVAGGLMLIAFPASTPPTGGLFVQAPFAYYVIDGKARHIDISQGFQEVMIDLGGGAVPGAVADR